MAAVPGYSFREREMGSVRGFFSLKIENYNPDTGIWSTIATGKDSYGFAAGKEITLSEGHPWPPSKKTPGKNIGGDFLNQKKYYLTNSLSDRQYSYNFEIFAGSGIRQRGTYTGYMIPRSIPLITDAEWPPDISSSKDELSAWGAKAIDFCKPTNSVANVSTALGELYRDGLPHLIGHTLWKGRSRPAKAAGGEYLNTQFGWRPLISDISQFVKGVSHANTVLEQFERDSGKVVRRHYNFPIDQTTEETVIGEPGKVFPQYSASYQFATSGGTLTRKRETFRRRWFSGAFTYHAPTTGLNPRSKLSEFALLADRLGVDPTPETLWNIAPWSWAVDWFSSTGSVISNLTAAAKYGLVMQYGYIMEHSYVRDTYTLTGVRNVSGAPVIVPPLTLVTETKKRQGANPFGFGLAWDKLNSFQTSIVVALGLSRGGR